MDLIYFDIGHRKDPRFLQLDDLSCCSFQVTLARVRYPIEHQSELQHGTAKLYHLEVSKLHDIGKLYYNIGRIN